MQRIKIERILSAINCAPNIFSDVRNEFEMNISHGQKMNMKLISESEMSSLSYPIFITIEWTISNSRVVTRIVLGELTLYPHSKSNLA